VSFPMMVGSTIVGGGWECVEGSAVFIAPVSKLLGIVMAAVIEVGLGGSRFWVVEGVEDVLNSADKDFFIDILPKVYTWELSPSSQVR
jgi:hypothetical protein